MTKSVWIYVNPRRDCVKVFESSDAALEWFQENDSDGVAIQWPVEQSTAVTTKPKRKDYETLVDAFLRTRAIFNDYIEDGKASRAVDRLFNVLINDDVLTAISRIEGRKRFGVIECVRPSVRDDAS